MPSFFQRLEAILRIHEDDFPRMLRAAGLDPATDLRGCGFDDVDFGRLKAPVLDLSHASLIGADLSKVQAGRIIITPETLHDHSTKWPDGFRPEPWRLVADDTETLVLVELNSDGHRYPRAVIIDRDTVLWFENGNGYQLASWNLTGKRNRRLFFRVIEPRQMADLTEDEHGRKFISFAPDTNSAHEHGGPTNG